MIKNSIKSHNISIQSLLDFASDIRLEEYNKSLDKIVDPFMFSLDNMKLQNIIYPDYYKYVIFIFGKMLEKLKHESKLDEYVKGIIEHIDIISKYQYSFLMRSEYNENKVMQEFNRKQTFTVSGNYLFFHGTSIESFQKIKESGELITSYRLGNDNDSNGIYEKRLEKILFSDMGKIFLSDDFGVCAQYAIIRSNEGVVMALNLDGYTLNQYENRMERQFCCDKAIPIERLVKAYRIKIIDNQIEVAEMEDE